MSGGLFDSGAEFNEDSGKLELDIDSGTLKMSDSGNVTYSGKPDPNYTGIYSNLVKSPYRRWRWRWLAADKPR